MQGNTHQRPFDTASEVTPIEGEVVIDGPDGIAASMTPDAAHETGERLLHAAAVARQQKGNDDAS